MNLKSPRKWQVCIKVGTNGGCSHARNPDVLRFLSMSRQQDFVLRSLDERGIQFVRLWFTDLLGYLKSVAISPAELEGAFEEGIGFDGSSIEGYSRITEADTILVPDPSTFQVLPWLHEDDKQHSARIFCDILMPDQTPSWADPRHVLRDVVNKASRMGFSCYAHPEIEFFTLKSLNTNGARPEAIDQGGYFDQAYHDIAPHFRRHAIEALESMGISVEFSHHETAPGQQEIDLRYADALSMADNIMTFRYIIKEVAINDGVRATFMPKPFTDYAGSGMHTHVSLFEGENNAFDDPNDPVGLSKTARSFMAGILEHADEISLLTNQWVNSYKRLGKGFEAPNAATWSLGNRCTMLRVPRYMPNKASSRRVEVRTLDPGCNPYLAFAGIFAAGLHGIEQGYELAPEVEEDVSALSSKERHIMGYPDLPKNLQVAIDKFEQSELMAEALGEHVFEFLIRSKRAEWDAYAHHVTPYELRHYLSL